MSSSGANEDYLIFCDFDGTIAEVDVGYRMLSEFSTVGNADLVERWNTRTIGARECLLLETARVQASRAEMLGYVDQFAIDSEFAGFVEFGESVGERVIVLSDGLDFYIKHLLHKYGLQRLELHTNHALCRGKSLAVEFPYNAGCGVCGACKSERIRTIKVRENFSGTVVFVGDGFSDICAIEEADILFAKSDLRRYCLDKDIPHIAFETFGDVGKALFANWPQVG